MLGKTNITTLSESAVVTEIEDYNWIQMQSGVFADFVRVIYKNGYLVGITADGTIVYTTDGDTWQTHTLEYEDCKLNDIDWDGSRFVLVGSCKETETLNEGTSEEIQRGLIVVTPDFTLYERKQVESPINYILEYFLVYPKNGKYIVVGSIKTSTVDTYICVGNLEEQWELHTSGGIENQIAKNSRDIIAIYHEYKSIQTSYYIRKISGNTISVNNYDRVSVGKNSKVFECKDELYIMSFNGYYNLYKITNSDECMVMCSEKNFAFVDGVYFNDCQIFINNHEMLIVKKGESIADKTLDDLIEIAPEFTMNRIIKAFGQLYIFGNQGVILKSSVETNNGETIIVQALSAKKALLEANKYTDEKYTDLINFVGPMKPFTKDVDANLNGTTAVKVLALDGTEGCGGYTEENIKFITAIAIKRGASLSTPIIAKMPGDNCPYIYIYNAENNSGFCKIRIHIE